MPIVRAVCTVKTVWVVFNEHNLHVKIPSRTRILVVSSPLVTSMSKNYRLSCVKCAGSTALKNASRPCCWVDSLPVDVHKRASTEKIVATDRKEHAVYKENALAATERCRQLYRSTDTVLYLIFSESS